MTQTDTLMLPIQFRQSHGRDVGISPPRIDHSFTSSVAMVRRPNMVRICSRSEGHFSPKQSFDLDHPQQINVIQLQRQDSESSVSSLFQPISHKSEH